MKLIQIHDIEQNTHSSTVYEEDDWLVDRPSRVASDFLAGFIVTLCGGDWLSYIGISWIEPFYLHQKVIHPDFSEQDFSEPEFSEKRQSGKLYILEITWIKLMQNQTLVNKPKSDFSE